MINWHIVTSAEFKAGEKHEDSIYFLTDTREIYRADKPYTESVILYTTLPTEGIAINRLYVDSTTLEGKINDGTGWKTVIRPVVDTVTEDGQDPVSAKGIAAYVAAELSKLNSQFISALSWDSAEHILSATKGTTTQSIVFDGLGVSLNYVAATGALQMLDASGNKIGAEVNLAIEQFVHSGEYDAANKKIILYFDTEKTNFVEIDASGLVDVYTGADSSTATVTVGIDNKISATVKISEEDGNTIVLKPDGIYVAAPDLTKYMTKVEGATAGHLATLDANGQVIDSGVAASNVGSSNVYIGDSIEEAVGANTPKDGDFAIIKTAAETEGTYNYTTYIYGDSTWINTASDSLKLTDISKSTDVITDPSDEKVVSEKLLLDSLTWKTSM